MSTLVPSKPPDPPRGPQELEDALRQRDQLQAEAQREFEHARQAHFPERRRGERRSHAGPAVTPERRRADRRG